MNEIIERCESELALAICAIQQPRTNFQLKHFVVGQHDTEPRRWMQCVLELQIKLQNLKRAAINRRKINRKIAAFAARGDEESADEAALLQIDRDEHELAIMGALRETEALFAIYQSFPRSYTRDEIDASEDEYWQKRIARQARHGILSNGSIGMGDLDSMAQIGLSIPAVIEESRTCLAMMQPPHNSNGLSPRTNLTPER